METVGMTSMSDYDSAGSIGGGSTTATTPSVLSSSSMRDFYIGAAVLVVLVILMYVGLKFSGDLAFDVKA